MRLAAILCLVATGCSPAADTSTDTVETDTTPTCQALTEGVWVADGAAFGMAMGVTLTLDASTCAFTLTNWSMIMGTLPDGGTIDGDTVTLTGSDPYWTTCSGEAVGGTAIDGVCSDDGAAFTLELN